MDELHSKITYDFDESYANEIISRAIDLIMKFNKECKKFMNALLLKDLEEMKSLQTNTNMNMIKEKMNEFVEEVSGFKYQKSRETAVQRDGIISRIGSTIIYEFGRWLFGMIGGLFTS